MNQALGTGVVFLELQLKEYTAAFFTFRDSIFGSDFYGTTCLHGLHVTTGSTSFGILWCSLNNNEGYKEVHQYQKFWGYYWHLVDSIWISLFMLFYLRIIFKAVVVNKLRWAKVPVTALTLGFTLPLPPMNILNYSTGSRLGNYYCSWRSFNGSFLGHIRLHIDHFCYNPLRTIFSIVNNYNFKLVL